MCGLAGIMAAAGRVLDEAIVTRMGAALARRGPDGTGYYHAGNVTMIHGRLAIIDLETGDQPLVALNGVALLANAEIYNYLELEKEFSPSTYTTRSDCEAPLHAYVRDGLGFADALRGMYAIAIHDPAEERLVLARDPFGIKPLYYAETDAGFLFASEAQALLASGLIAPQVAERPRAELLQLQFTTGADTIFPGIHRVLPGETLVVRQGRIIERRRRAALPAGGPRAQSEEEGLRQLDAVLRDSVTVHQRSDVPYGMFLSGGVDSSVLLALMAQLNDRPVRAFTAGFGGPVPDERAHARMLARKVGAEHVEVEVTEKDFWALLPSIAAAMDDPAADYAVVPTFKLAQVAAQDLKVILCGEGGDELFAGYGRHRAALRPWWLGGRALRARGTLDGLGVLRDERSGWRDGIVAAESVAGGNGRTRLQVAQAVDCADWLPHDLLSKLDRCLMTNGVEGRTPFLDPAVADFAFRLPDSLKIRGGQGKYLLRRWLERQMPEAEPFARKRGFTVPVASWIATRGRALGELVARQPGVEAVCRPGNVAALFESPSRRAGFAAWVLLFYALWHRHHVLRLPAAGDVLATLAAPR